MFGIVHSGVVMRAKLSHPLCRLQRHKVRQASCLGVAFAMRTPRFAATAATAISTVNAASGAEHRVWCSSRFSSMLKLIDTFLISCTSFGALPLVSGRQEDVLASVFAVFCFYLFALLFAIAPPCNNTTS